MLVEKQVRDFTMVLDTEDAGISRQLLGGGGWEGVAPDILESIIKPDWTCLEMGACIGFYMLLEAGRAKRIHAFEADPHNVAILQQAVEVNGFENITIHRRAIAGTNGVRKFHRSPGRTDRGRLSGNGDISVECVTLDTFVERESITTVNVVRCDIEGSEVGMIQGGRETLAAMPVGSWLFIDFHPVRYVDKKPMADAIKYLLSCGFEPKKILGSVRGYPANLLLAICNNPGFPKVFMQKCG